MLHTAALFLKSFGGNFGYFFNFSPVFIYICVIYMHPYACLCMCGHACVRICLRMWKAKVDIESLPWWVFHLTEARSLTISELSDMAGFVSVFPGFLVSAF